MTIGEENAVLEVGELYCLYNVFCMHIVFTAHCMMISFLVGADVGAACICHRGCPLQ